MTLFSNSTSNENNFIYSSRKHQRGRQNTVFVVVESHSILYSSKNICLQVDWFTELFVAYISLICGYATQWITLLRLTCGSATLWEMWVRHI